MRKSAIFDGSTTASGKAGEGKAGEGGAVDAYSGGVGFVATCIATCKAIRYPNTSQYHHSLLYNKIYDARVKNNHAMMLVPIFHQNKSPR